jgi:hypothetical protein
MRNVSYEFLQEIVKPSRNVDAKIVIGTTTITSDDIISYEITSSLTDNEMPTIGSAVSSSIKFEVLNESLPLIYVGEKIEIYAGLEINGITEWVKMGVFRTSNEYIVKKKLTTEIEAFDEIYWLNDTIFVSSLTYPANLMQMINELESVYGIEFSDEYYAMEERRTHESLEAYTYGDLESYWYQPDLTNLLMFHIDPTQEDYSIRSILSQMALLTSANVITDSDGKIKFKYLQPTDFHITGENYIDYERLSDADVLINQLVVKNPELDEEYISGSNVGFSVQVNNSGIISQEQTNDIRNRVYPVSYTPYSMSLQGMPHVEVGDTIRFTEVDQTLVTLFVINYKFTYNGGFKSQFTTKAPEKKEIETSPFRNASATVSSETIRQTNITLETAITNASELITGGQGGHLMIVRDEITGKPQELVILIDSDDINTAQMLWRFNSGGLGFSSNGYNGTYGLAMTADGAIVADAITTGVLNASLLKAGIIQNGTDFWDLVTGYFNLGNVLIRDEDGARLVYDKGLVLTFDSNNGLSITHDGFETTLTAYLYEGSDDVKGNYSPFQFTWYKQVAGQPVEYAGYGYTYDIGVGEVKSATTYICEFEIRDDYDLLTTLNDLNILTISDDNIVVSGFTDPTFKRTFSATVVYDASGKVDSTQEDVFNVLTKNGAVQGIFLDANGDLYINGEYIQVGTLTADKITGGSLKIGGISGYDGEITIYDADGREVVKLDKDGMVISMFYNELGEPTNQFLIKDGETSAELLRIGANGELYYAGPANFTSGVFIGANADEVWHTGNTRVDSNGFIKAL